MQKRWRLLYADCAILPKAIQELASGLIALLAVARVSGSVLDPTGKAIAGARVTMTETSKGQVRTTASDEQGNYTLPALPVGPYRLEVAATGFKDYVQSGLVLQVGNNIQINVGM